MTERHTPIGGVRDQLRSLAERGSFEGDWRGERAQTVAMSRTLSVPGEDPAYLRVAFQGERYSMPGRGARLMTHYSLSALLRYEELPVALVPETVAVALKNQNTLTWHQAYVDGKVAIINSSPDASDETMRQLMREDASNIDDALFCFERELTYTLDGRGQLLVEQRADRFFEMESPRPLVEVKGELQFAANHTVLSSLIADDHALPEVAHNACDELLQHPDLRKLEYKVDKATLRTDMSFAEIISGVEYDRALTAASRRSRQQDLLTLLAFLRYDAPASHIMALVS